MRLVYNNIHEGGSGKFLMKPSSGEIHISRYKISRLYKNFRYKMLCCASLMSGHKVRIAVIFLYVIPKVIEILAPCVGFVTKHHSRPLRIAHCVSTAVGQQIYIHVLRFQ